MEFEIFSIPAAGGSGTEELNRFLRSHRVLNVERELVTFGNHAMWTFCVEYLAGAAASKTLGPSEERVDYKAVLPPPLFEKYAGLRVVRKSVAAKEGIPPNAVFTLQRLFGRNEEPGRLFHRGCGFQPQCRLAICGLFMESVAAVLTTRNWPIWSAWRRPACRD